MKVSAESEGKFGKMKGSSVEGKTEKEKNTSERIIQVARELFAQKGYSAVSMDEIAKRVGIKKASLYYHFKSKDEIYRTIIQKAIDEVLKILEVSFSGENIVEEAKNFSVKIHEFIFENKDYVKIMAREIIDGNISPKEISQKYIPIVLKFGVKILEEGQKKGIFRRDVDPNHLAFTIAGAILIYFLMEKVSEAMFGKLSKKKVRERAVQVFDIIINGLLEKQVG